MSVSSTVKKVVLIFAALLLLFQPINSYAINDSFYSGNGILFFDPGDTCLMGGSVGDNNLPTSTLNYLKQTVSIDTKIEANKPRYEYAEQQTGVPWQAIAALHFREAGLDSTKSILNGSDLGSGIDSESGLDISKDPNEDAKNAAIYFKEVALSTYSISAENLNNASPILDWGSAFLAFHAGASFEQHGVEYTQSTYVVNGLFNNSLNMHWVGIPLETESGVDSKLAGALTILKYLGSLDTTQGCLRQGAVGGDVIKTGMNFALDHPAKDNVEIHNYDARASYIEAAIKFNGREPTGIQVTDCGRFVSIVMRSSGADTSYPVQGTGVQLPYLRTSSKYREVTSEDLMPGDILIYAPQSAGASGHTMIYSGPNGSYLALDASLGQRVPSVRPSSSVDWIKTQSGYSAWRLKNE